MKVKSKRRKIGETVRVRRDLIVDAEYNGYIIMPEMEPWLGKEATVTASLAGGTVVQLDGKYYWPICALEG